MEISYNLCVFCQKKGTSNLKEPKNSTIPDQIVRPGDSKTFGDYAHQKFERYITYRFGDLARVDVLFDIYKDDSLKAALKEKRGEGQRQLIKPNVKLPSVWSKFLRVDENKKELFTFLGKEIVTNSSDSDQLIICTIGDIAISNKLFDLSDVSPCDHEESDSRIMVHVKDAVNRSHNKITIQTVDSDAVGVAVRGFFKIEDLTELWIAFGSGKHFRYIPAHEVALTLEPERSLDVTSFFYGIGKTTAWKVWLGQDDFEYTNCFQRIIENNNVDDIDLRVIEKFVIKLYDKHSTIETIHDARKQLFSKRNRFDSIPPTLESLQEHLKRAIYQGSLIWCNSTERILNLPSPLEYGWKTAGTVFAPFWTQSEEAASSYKQLTKCGCKSFCLVNVKTGKSRCKCKKQSLECTTLSSCTCFKK